MERFARSVVRHRRFVLVLAVLLLIPSYFGAVGTYINYDILTYLPPSLESMVGETYLENDFNIASTAMITVENMTTADRLKLKNEIAAVPGVTKVTDASDVLDSSVPKEMLPDEIRTFFCNDSNASMMMVTFDHPGADAGTMAAIKKIKTLLKVNCFIGGASAILQDTKAIVDQEMPMYILVAFSMSIVVLFLSMHETIGPLIFMLAIVFPILYNFGSNIIFGRISYVTEALSTCLQLGVTMDYSIFLLQRFEEEEKLCAKDEAMVQAICHTATSITGSSLTTVVGFLALCTMQLTIGGDIGLVMAKGVLLGVISTITILPALIMAFQKSIEKHRHRTFIRKFNRTSHFIVDHYKAILVVFLVLFVPFAAASAKTEVYYTLSDSMPQDMESMIGTNRLKSDFNMTTTHFIIVDDSLSNEDVSSMVREIRDVDGITNVLSYEQFVGAGIPEAMIPSDVLNTFHAGGHILVIANSNLKAGTDAMGTQVGSLEEIVKRYDPSGLITGEGAMTKDLIRVADTDFAHVQITSILLVFLIVLFVSRSASIPVLLVAVIESAIMINLGIPYFTGTVLPFIASIIVSTIQLGATVDYAILITSRFREELGRGRPVKEAMQITVRQCSRSVLTSGLTFFTATFSVALIARVRLLSSICLLISRGALISMAVVLFVLPGLEILTEPLIKKTTYHWITAVKESADDEND